MKQYGNNEPPLDIFDYFQGTTTGWGIVQDRNGNLTRQFKVTIKGSIIKTIERRIGT